MIDDGWWTMNYLLNHVEENGHFCSLWRIYGYGIVLALSLMQHANTSSEYWYYCVRMIGTLGVPPNATKYHG